MIVEILIIGDELLDGRRIDSNSAWLGRQFTALGMPPRFRQTVSDRVEEISDAWKLALSRSDIVLSTGGLGPTQDDLTFESLAHAFDRELVFHEDIYEEIKRRFEVRGLRCPESNRRQAMLPKGGKPLDNEKGTAPGCRLEANGGKLVFVLPGPPPEMQVVFDKHIRPEIQERFLEGGTRLERVFKFVGLAESHVEERIERCRLGEMNGADIRVAYTASFPEIDVTLSLVPTADEDAKSLMNQAHDTIRREFAEHLIAIDDEKMESQIIDELVKRNWKISVAESLTGGMVASTLINVPGSSEVFEQGFVTYSDQSKIERLGVNEETLKKKGAVSSETALEMAKGVREKSGTEVGISTTGIAGPGGETPTKPVGLVYVAWSTPEEDSVEEFRFRWDRHRNRIFTTAQALKGLLHRLKK